MQLVKTLFSIVGVCMFFLSTSLISCKKEKIEPPVTPEVVELTDDAAQDTYVTFWNGDADWANSNGDWAEELAMHSWTIGGMQMGVRSYLQFDKISAIPAGAEILSAKLYLFAKGSSISAPQGNSGYSGSAYNTDNECKIERVTGGAWDEATLSWNTQPGVTATDAVLIPASTSHGLIKLKQILRIWSKLWPLTPQKLWF